MKVVTSMDRTWGAPCKNKRQPSTFYTMHTIALGLPQTCCNVWIALLHVWAQAHTLLSRRGHTLHHAPYLHSNFRKPAKALGNPVARHLAHKSSIVQAQARIPLLEKAVRHHAPYLSLGLPQTSSSKTLQHIAGRTKPVQAQACRCLPR